MYKHNAILLLIILFVLAISDFKSLNAQTWIGLRQGVGISQTMFHQSGLQKIEQEYFSAFSSGLLFRHYSEKYAGIQIELNYTKKGWKEIDSTDYRKCDISYIELPFMAQFRLGGKKLEFIISAGSLLGYSIQTKEDINYKIKDEPESYVFKPLEFAITGGIGVNFKTKKSIFQLEVRYTHELLNAIETFNIVPRTSFAQIQYLYVSLSYMFKINKL